MPAYIKLGDIEGEKPGTFYRYKFTDMPITSVSTGGSSGDDSPALSSGPGQATLTRAVSAQVSPFRLLATSGKRLTTVQLIETDPKAGTNGSTITTLSGVQVVEAKTASAATEEITISYRKIVWEYSNAKDRPHQDSARAAASDNVKRYHLENAWPSG